MSDQAYTILVVDDNDLNRDMLSRRLRRKGFSVVTARDGYEALRLVRDGEIDLVLLDIMMPGISGLEVLRTLRERHAPSELPVVMATAKDQSEDMVEAFDLGASDYVTKPLDFKIVLARVQAHLRTLAAARRAHLPPPAPVHDELEVGKVVEGKYLLESRIGSGNFGDVFRAVHLSLERPVAVKLLQSRVGTKPAELDRFRQEGISSCRLDHPNAVAVLDFGVTASGVAFLVMELLEGRSLADELASSPPMSPERCYEILKPISEVLTESHSLGIIHRDIKPGNIFLHQSRGREVVKVVDFGIAKLAGDAAVRQNMTIDGGIIGTPAYMAPERLTGRRYDGRSDVYSLGVMLFEMLTGALPFTGTTDPMSIAFMHVQRPPPPLRQVRSDLSRSLEAVIQQALEKDFRMRPTARLLAKKFERAVATSEPSSGEAQPASPPSQPQRTLVLPPD